MTTRVKEVTRWKTSDGEEWLTKPQAEEHEAQLRKYRLSSLMGQIASVIREHRNADEIALALILEPTIREEISRLDENDLLDANKIPL